MVHVCPRNISLIPISQKGQSCPGVASVHFLKVTVHGSPATTMIKHLPFSWWRIARHQWDRSSDFLRIVSFIFTRPSWHKFRPVAALVIALAGVMHTSVVSHEVVNSYFRWDCLSPFVEMMRTWISAKRFARFPTCHERICSGTRELGHSFQEKWGRKNRVMNHSRDMDNMSKARTEWELRPTAHQDMAE